MSWYCAKHWLVSMAEYPFRLGCCGILGHRMTEYVTNENYYCSEPWTEKRCSCCGDGAYRPFGRFSCLWLAFFALVFVFPFALLAGIIRLAFFGQYKCDCTNKGLIFPMTRAEWEKELGPAARARAAANKARGEAMWRIVEYRPEHRIVGLEPGCRYYLAAVSKVNFPGENIPMEVASLVPLSGGKVGYCPLSDVKECDEPGMAVRKPIPAVDDGSWEDI